MVDWVNIARVGGREASIGILGASVLTTIKVVALLVVDRRTETGVDHSGMRVGGSGWVLGIEAGLVGLCRQLLGSTGSVTGRCVLCGIVIPPRVVTNSVNVSLKSVAITAQFILKIKKLIREKYATAA